MKSTRTVIAVMVLSCSFFIACSSSPKVSESAGTESQARRWLKKYCSKGSRELGGNLVVKSNTREFKGQFPASVLVKKNGEFQLEVTNIIGGTLLRLTSNGMTLQILSPSRPQFNQSVASQYLGLEIPILTELLLGDLPCPNEGLLSSVRVEGSLMVVQTPTWRWSFEKSDGASGEVPFRILLSAQTQSGAPLKVELRVEEWDLDQSFAKKVSVLSPEGELKWVWRSRN
jgi:hypothetical protein